MKIVSKIFMVAAAAVMIVGCGSVTEVGNPTGEIPTLRTIEGVIDVSTIDTTKADNAYSIDPTLLTVAATATDGSTKETSVDVDASFTIGLEVGKTYAMDVRTEGQIIGPFSFEQNDLGERANRVQVRQAGTPINLGEVRYENGEFIPQYEPRRQMGVGPGGPDS